MADPLQRGDDAKIDVTIRDVNGELADPASLTFTTVSPLGIESNYVYPDAVIVRLEQGRYRAIVPLNEVGTWLFQWLSEAPGQVGGGSLLVGPAPIDPAVALVGPLAPAAADVRMWAPPAFDWAAYGFPAGAAPDPLEVRVQWAVGQLYAITGRTLASITTIEDVAVAQKVLAAFVMMEVTGGGRAALAVLEQPWLKSFSAGSYSETRFSPAELAGGQSKAPPYPLSLWWLLWALMTSEKRAEWRQLLTGQTPPAAAFVPVDFAEGWLEVGPMVGGGAFDSGW